MIDDFARPDQNLIGSTASSGQTYVVTLDAYPTMLIRSDELTGVTNSQTGGQVDTLFSGPQFAADWWCLFRAKGLQAVGAGSAFGVWFGSDGLAVYAGVIAQGAGGSSLLVHGGNLGPADFGTNVTLDDPADEHEFLFQWISAGGHVKLYVDDVLVQAASGYVLDLSTAKDFVVSQLLDGVTDPVPMTLIEVGTGVYPVGP